jgi:hypothetical protein
MNRKENICEYSLLGLFPMYEARDELAKLKEVNFLEDLCEDKFIKFHYEITTYKLEATEGFRTISNLVELHRNQLEI